MPEAPGHLPRLQERERQRRPPRLLLPGAPITGAARASPVFRGRQARSPSTSATASRSPSGPAKKNDSVGRCWDLAAATWTRREAELQRDPQRRRQQRTLCDCQFIDWSHDGNGGHVAGRDAADEPDYWPPPTSTAPAATRCTGSGADRKERGQLRRVVRRRRGDQNTHTAGRWSSQLAGTSTSSPASRTSVYAGFFPLDPPGQFPVGGRQSGPGVVRVAGTEQMLCNLWPYWIPTAFPELQRGTSTCFRPASRRRSPACG